MIKIVLNPNIQQDYLLFLSCEYCFLTQTGPCRVHGLGEPPFAPVDTAAGHQRSRGSTLDTSSMWGSWPCRARLLSLSPRNRRSWGRGGGQPLGFRRGPPLPRLPELAGLADHTVPPAGG